MVSSELVQIDTTIRPKAGYTMLSVEAPEWPKRLCFLRSEDGKELSVFVDDKGKVTAEYINCKTWQSRKVVLEDGAQ